MPEPPNHPSTNVSPDQSDAIASAVGGDTVPSPDAAAPSFRRCEHAEWAPCTSRSTRGCDAGPHSR
jgi:hypothetical protein